MSSPAQTTDDEQILPALRNDLKIERSEGENAGWMIIDPVRQSYFRINQSIFDILSVWQSGAASRLRAAFMGRFSNTIGDAQIDEVVEFLTANELTEQPKEAGWRHYAGLAKSREKSILSASVHSYLFFRVPLLRPQRFLDAAWPFLGWLFTTKFFASTCVLGVVAIWLVSRQWDVFTSTFAGFLTFEGLAAYSVVLACVKVIHELGHAFMAKKYGAHVSTLGVAFIVLFPILYTDTTAAWQLERRKRLMIDAGGIFAELSVAVMATLLWVFLPEGTMRSLAFVVATISWFLSLAVNLNPLMRFDGYYLLSDALGAENLQERGFAIARWRMREALFGLGEAPPENMPSGMRRALIVHAYATWVYRFFLFLGIALIVYHMFFKLAGIALFAVEIVWFIGLPIWRELKQWWARRQKFTINATTMRTVMVASILLGVLFVPWRQSIHAPAVLTAASVELLYPRGAGRLVEHSLIEGERVAKGDVLAIIEDVDLTAQLKTVKTAIALLETRLARTVADAEDRSFLTVLERELISRQQELAVLENRARDLTVVAPVDGRVSNVLPNLRAGDYVSLTTRLGLITTGEVGAVRAFINSSLVDRLAQGAFAKFIPEEPEQGNSDLVLIDLAPVLQSEPLIRLQFDIYGGAISTSMDPDTNEFEPQSPVYQASFSARSGLAAPSREMRGTIHIDAAAESLAYRIVRQIAGVLVRESGF